MNNVNISVARTASLIHKELVFIVNKIVQNEQIGYINITDVHLQNDFSSSQVFYTILSDDPQILSLAQKIIEKNKKAIRVALAKQIKNIKRIPVLNFEYDHSLFYGEHIEHLLNEIKK
ncbi:30S ribosome-binding factor RbfA [Candidatus Phytoplasma melaleucae]|uniref:Ribosome-binding factor A n=1 Tax=Candidatus Phytoplasma melaleucae TaxID=2982630 RepID=A0ABT9DCX8_9MOLU|nr:30S ribosome-binding factor RbfA ['Melaleuca sp.' phytoplasma]MDO8167958.1 30S ribosome-binding factor RbfA ['Melaleuca sp.' phytoplasma]MDV3205406.1 30S ribosome-binding factor RbfA [Weeping tea tree witches'-broom phytoplasma]